MKTPSDLALKLVTPTVIPGRPRSAWPVGVRLRFHPSADMGPGAESLRGSLVLVVSELRLVDEPGPRYAWRQQVLSLTTGRVVWARPDQLDLPLDIDDAP